MITNDKKENNNNDNVLKEEAFPREITGKTCPDTEKANTDGIHESMSNDSCHKKDIQSSQKSESNNNSKYKRIDSFGNLIKKKGKQKISFIDKITKKAFVDVIKIESYKAYNKMEELSHTNMQNNCCIIE